jgi:hypothetical protein
MIIATAAAIKQFTCFCIVILLFKLTSMVLAQNANNFRFHPLSQVGFRRDLAELTADLTVLITDHIKFFTIGEGRRMIHG